MNLAELSIKRPVFAWMLMSALIIFGAICFGKLGVSLLPDVEIPTVYVQADWAGAAPEIMETEIVDQIEQALTSVSGIDNLSSVIRQGSAQITLEFRPGRNIDAALLEVQAGISKLRLPREVESPRVYKMNPADREIMWLGISSPSRSMHDLTVYAERHLRDKFQVLPGVGQLVLSGFTGRNLRVWVDYEKLREYDLTVLDVRNALRTQHIEQAGGFLENNREEINVRLMGEGATVDKVGAILIKQRGGEPIYRSKIHLRDVARIEDGLDDVRSFFKIHGIPGGGIGFRKERGFNSIEVADEIKKKLEEIRRGLPEDIKIEIIHDESVYTREAVEETEFTLILSAVLTALICWLFLGSLSSTFNVVMSIPTSVLGTFIILYFLGFTLNIFTLLALSLAIGIVVDDAIMVLENIVRHYEMGKDRCRAALDGAREITPPAVAATLAVLAVFLPVAFMEGTIGKFLFQFGIAISAAVALSLVEAVTLIPMRCSQFLSVRRSHRVIRGLDHGISRLSGIYRNLLAGCLHHRLLVVGILTGLFALSLFIAGLVPIEAIPSQDRSTILVQYETPVGSSLEFTRDRLAEAEKMVKKHKEVRTYLLAGGSFMGANVNSGIMFISLVPRHGRDLSQAEIAGRLREELSTIADLKSYLIDLSKTGLSGDRMSYPISFSLQGPDPNVLKEESIKLGNWMKKEKVGVDINTDFKEGQPELRVHVDDEAAFDRGVTVLEISDTVAASIGGIREGKYTNGDRRYDVRLRLEAGERSQADDLLKLTVRNIYGEIVPIREVINYEIVPSLQTIARRNRERAITMNANPFPGVPEGQSLERIKRHADETLPVGYRLVASNAAEAGKKMQQDMVMALSLGLLIAYMILASQFNSYSHPFLIFLAMPFALSGALVSLWLAAQSLNMYSFIGLILLMGIVKKNSILLVEFTHQLREREGMAADEALLKACPIRLRPVLMTSVATVAAAIPPALALGPGAESRIPMALTIIGGSAVSMLATLFMVPCSYSLMESIGPRIRALADRTVRGK